METKHSINSCGRAMINPGDSDGGAKTAPDVSNELGNYCCADRQLPLDYLWMFDAPGTGIGAPCAYQRGDQPAYKRRL